MATTRTPEPTVTDASAAAIADPAPLGLAAFAMTTMVLSVFNANILDSKLQAVALPLALAYGGLGQLLAGMWEFRKGNTFGATAFSSYGAFWLSFYFLAKDVLPSLLTQHGGGKAVGVYLLAWAIFTAYMTIAATRVSGAVLAVFAFLTLTFLVLSIGWFQTNGDAVIHVGGWLGLITAALAWYASFAGVTAFTFGRHILPTWSAAKR